jgi:hypothetical protein
MALCVAVPSSVGLLAQLRRPAASEPSELWDIVYSHSNGRPSRFAPCVFSRVEVSGVRRDVGFCGGHSLVVSARPSRAGCVLVARPSR